MGAGVSFVALSRPFVTPFPPLIPFSVASGDSQDSLRLGTASLDRIDCGISDANAVHVVQKLLFSKVFLAACLFAGIVAQATELPSQAAVLSTGMDTAIQPGDDFYAYANGDWLKAAS